MKHIQNHSASAFTASPSEPTVSTGSAIGADVNEPKSLQEIRKALRALFKAIRHCKDPQSRKRLQRVFTKLNEIGGDMLPEDKTISLDE